MNVLLDTHTFLWWLLDSPELSVLAREVIAEPGNEVYVSAATAWEIATKFRLGKLPGAAPVAKDVAGWIARRGFRALPVGVLHAQRAGSWALPHRDPFDRMIAAQSEVEQYPVVSRDPALQQFGIEVLW